MGFRFRKSIKIAPGIRFNLNKKSVGLTVGPKGAHYSVNSSGRRTASVGIPGTGIAYTAQSGGSAGRSTSSRGTMTTGGSAPDPNRPPFYTKTWFVVLMLILFAPVGIFLLWKYKNCNKVLKGVLSALFGLVFLLAVIPSESEEPAVPAVASSTGSSVTSAASMPEPSASSSSGSVIEPPSSSGTLIEPPSSSTGSVIEPPSSSSGTLIEPPSSSAGTVIVPPISSDSTPGSVVPEDNKDEEVVYVWITKTGSKYHSIPNCGNTKSAYEISLNEAKAKGFTACSKCY